MVEDVSPGQLSGVDQAHEDVIPEHRCGSFRTARFVDVGSLFQHSFTDVIVQRCAGLSLQFQARVDTFTSGESVSEVSDTAS